MADASETIVTEQEVAMEAAEKKEDMEKTNGGEEAVPQKVEEPAPEGLAESSGDKAEDVPTDILAAEMVVVAANEPVVETVPDAKPEAEVVETEAKTEEEAAVETILEVKQEDELAKEMAANELEKESIRTASQTRILEEEAVPEEVIKDPGEPKEVAEAENEKQIEIPSLVEDKAVNEEALEDKKEEAIAKEVIEDKAVVEEAVKEEKAAVAKAEATGPVKPEKKQSRNVISKMKRTFSKAKKAFAGKLPGSKTADNDAKA